MTKSSRASAAFAQPKSLFSSVITGCIAAAWLISAHEYGLTPQATHAFALLFSCALIPVALLLRKPLVMPSQLGAFLIFAVSYGVVSSAVCIAIAIVLYGMIYAFPSNDDEGENGNGEEDQEDSLTDEPVTSVSTTVTREKKFGFLTVRHTTTVTPDSKTVAFETTTVTPD